jgi:hypothetical protein
MTVSGTVTRVVEDYEILTSSFALIKNIVVGAARDRAYVHGRLPNWYNHSIASESVTHSQELCNDARLIPGFLEHLDGVPAIYYPMSRGRPLLTQSFILITATGTYWAVAPERKHLNMLIEKALTKLHRLGVPSGPQSPTNVTDLDEPSDDGGEDTEEEEEEEEEDEEDDEREETESGSDDDDDDDESVQT